MFVAVVVVELSRGNNTNGKILPFDAGLIDQSVHVILKSTSWATYMSPKTVFARDKVLWAAQLFV